MVATGTSGERVPTQSRVTDRRTIALSLSAGTRGAHGGGRRHRHPGVEPGRPTTGRRPVPVDAVRRVRGPPWRRRVRSPVTPRHRGRLSTRRGDLGMQGNGRCHLRALTHLATDRQSRFRRSRRWVGRLRRHHHPWCCPHRSTGPSRAAPPCTGPRRRTPGAAQRRRGSHASLRRHPDAGGGSSVPPSWHY